MDNLTALLIGQIYCTYIITALISMVVFGGKEWLGFKPKKVKHPVRPVVLPGKFEGLLINEHTRCLKKS